MKSDELIAILSNAAPMTRAPINIFVSSILVVSFSFLLIVFSYGLRPDFASAVTTVHFWYKTLFLLILSMASMHALFQSFRPTGKPDHFLNLLAGLWITTTFLSILEILYADVNIITQNVVAPQTVFCMAYISILGMVSMIPLTIMSRYFAPIQLKQAGGLIGFSSGVFVGLGYSFHCMVDFGSYLLIAYGFPIFILSFIGYVVLPRFLRW